MPLDERALFNDKPETRPGRFQCPKCHRTNDYSIRWVRRSKKDRLPPGADEVDRAKFAKLRDYLLRLDDQVACKTCGKKFEIPSQWTSSRGFRTKKSSSAKSTWHPAKRSRNPNASRRCRPDSPGSPRAGNSKSSTAEDAEDAEGFL